MLKQQFKEAKPTLVFAAVLVILVLVCTWALAEPEIGVQVGYDGAIFFGRWYPLCVQIEAGEEGIDGELTVDIGVKPAYYDRLRLPLSLKASETAQFRIPIMPRIEQRSFTIRVHSGGEVLAEKTVRAASVVPQEALIIGALNDQAGLADALGAIVERNVRGELEVIRGVALDAQSFPQSAEELEAFDALVIADSAALPMESAELLEAWKRLGGVLIEGTAAQPVSAMTARQIFDEIARVREENGAIQRDGYSSVFGERLASQMRLDEGNGILGAALVLAAYAVFAGCGLYLLMKRLDRSKELWLAIPAAAALVCGLMVCFGHTLGIKEPAAVSVHVTHTDLSGKTSAHELALVNAAQQERMTMAAEDKSAIERMEYTGFSSWVQMEEAEMALRDVITLGDSPSLELSGQAAWKRRALLVKSEALPQGRVEASCHVEEDGLHAVITNGMDTVIRNAVLITELGFARLGDLQSGETKQAVLARTDRPQYNDDGLLMIVEGQMNDYQENISRVISFCADPESALVEDFDTGRRSDREAYEIDLESARLSLAGNVARSEALDCILVGDLPDVSCQTLLLDGKPIERTAQRSVLVHEIPLETRAADGWLYYPQQTFGRAQASLGEHGRPVLSKTAMPSYAEGEKEILFGFALGSTAAERVTALHISRTVYSSEDGGVVLEYYNHQTGKWQAMEKNDRVTLSGSRAQQAVSPAGEVFFRYRGEHLDETGVRLPEIAVEGWQPVEGASEGKAAKGGSAQ